MGRVRLAGNARGSAGYQQLGKDPGQPGSGSVRSESPGVSPRSEGGVPRACGIIGGAGRTIRGTENVGTVEGGG